MGFRDKFKKVFKSEKEKDEHFESQDGGNFKHLAYLIAHAEREVILDSDIILSSDEEEKYLEGIKLDPNDIIIDGNGHTIDACGKTRVFKVSGENILLKNITFKNGSNIEGGAVYVDNFARLKIIDCIFQDNNAEKYGGAIVNFAEISLERVDFTRNNTKGNGSAIYNQLIGNIDLVSCSFNNNAAQNKGGAIYNFGKISFNGIDFAQNTAKEGGTINNQKDGNISLINCSFNNNASQEGGGAILNFGEISLNDTGFTQNTTKEGNGGAINNQEKGNISLVNCSFNNNATQNKGGAILNFGKIAVDKTGFENNDSMYGGAIYNFEGAINILKTNFIKNTSQNDGGAINNNQESSNLEVDDCKFIDNKSGAGGGAIVNWGNTTITNSEFKDNISETQGHDINFQNGSFKLSNVKFNDTKEKSIFSANDDLMEIDNCEFIELDYDKLLKETSERNFRYLDLLVHSSENEITLDSDIVLEDNEENEYRNGINLEREDLVIDGNGYSIDAAGKARIFIINGNITLKNITLKNGYSKEMDGGAIYHQGNSNLIIENAHFINNTTEARGGAIINFGDITLKESNFEKNNSNFGGAIYVDNFARLKINDCIFKDNMSEKDGGAINNNQESSNLEVDDCKFIDNKSGAGGGAIVNWGNTTITNSEFKDNISETQGHDINFQNGSFKLSNVKFNDTKERSIYSEDDTLLKLENCVFEQNFKYLDKLVNSSTTKEIVLDSNIILDDDDEEYKYEEGIAIDTNDLVIDGDGHTIDAQNLTRIFIINGNNITLKNLKFKNGFSSYGSAICCNENSSLEVNNCSFMNNNSDSSGGAIENKGKIVVKESFFENNNSKEGGGAISNNADSILNITRTTFIKNTAKIEGGAINNNKISSNLNVNECEFIENTSTYGGAIINRGNSNINDSEFKNNISQKEGNDIYVESEYLKLSNVKFNSTQDKSIFSTDDNLLKLENCEFVESENDGTIIDDESDERNFNYLDKLINSGEKNIVLDSDIIVDGNEDIIYSDGIKLGVDGLIIDGDGHKIDAKSLTRIFYASGKNITLKNLKFENGLNSAGAAIYINESGCLEIKDCTFKDNVAESSGGAIFNNGKIVLDGVTFSKNTSKEESGGAISNEEGEMSLSRCSFNDNSSGEDGGAIFNWGEINLENVNFIDNTASNNGGAINNQIGGNVTGDNCSFSGNKAKEGGAVYAMMDNEVTFSDCTFKDNEPDDKYSLM